MSSGYRQVDHTADLALELWAPTQQELLIVGARAVIAVLTEDCPVNPGATRDVEIDGLDPDDRLVQWLNEIIFAAVTGGFLFDSAEMTLGESSLSAHVRGEPDAAGKIRTELKSATYHDLSLAERDDGWYAFVVIDV